MIELDFYVKDLESFLEMFVIKVENQNLILILMHKAPNTRQQEWTEQLNNTETSNENYEIPYQIWFFLETNLLYLSWKL